MSNVIAAVAALLPAWEERQWIAFAGVTTAGLGALGLLGYAVRTVRGWTAPATYRSHTAPARPRPSLQLAERRALLPAPTTPLRAGSPAVVVTATGEIVHVDPTHVDPMHADYASGGVSSLATLRAVGEGSLIAAEPAVDAETAAAFAEVFAAWSEDLRVAFEPIERTLRLWNARAHGGVVDQARRQLDEWRINTPTGEYPLVYGPAFFKPEIKRELFTRVSVA